MPRTRHAYPNAATLTRRYEAAVRATREFHEFDPHRLRQELAALREVRDLLAEGRQAKNRTATIDFSRRWSAVFDQPRYGMAILYLRFGWIDGR